MRAGGREPPNKGEKPKGNTPGNTGLAVSCSLRSVWSEWESKAAAGEIGTNRTPGAEPSISRDRKTHDGALGVPLTVGQKVGLVAIGSDFERGSLGG